MNLYEYLLDGKPREAKALITLGGEYTYGDLECAAESVARLL